MVQRSRLRIPGIPNTERVTSTIEPPNHINKDIRPCIHCADAFQALQSRQAGIASLHFELPSPRAELHGLDSKAGLLTQHTLLLPLFSPRLASNIFSVYGETSLDLPLHQNPLSDHLERAASQPRILLQSLVDRSTTDRVASPQWRPWKQKKRSSSCYVCSRTLRVFQTCKQLPSIAVTSRTTCVSHWL